MIDWTGFDLPEQRKSDWRWLMRNLAARNATHPRFSEVMEAVKAEFRKSLTPPE